MENIFFPKFIDKFLKIEEVEHHIHYVKFKMWPVLFYLNSHSFSNIEVRLYIISPNLHRDWKLGFWMLL